MSLARIENVDQAAVLKTLNLNPADPHTQAVLLICQKYGLDPLLKHVVLIQGRPYITRDGYLSFAHDSGQFDGIEIIEEGENDDCWWARAAVYRKDMGRPFTYRGRYPKRNAGNPKYGPEMAIKTAEVMALRRAFNVSGLPAADEQWDTPEPTAPTMTPAVAKGRLLTLAGGDKDAAVEAWKRAGIPDGQMVSEAELTAAEDELRQLGWAWSPSPDSYEDPSDGDDDDPDPEPPAGGPGGGVDDAGGAPDSDAGDTATLPASDAGRADMDEPPASSTANAAGQQPPRGLTAKQVAQKAGVVFKADYDAAPRGQKTRLVERLRHALTFAQTAGSHASLSRCNAHQLLQVWQRLDDIAEGRMSYEIQHGDEGGVTWISQTGRRTTVMWAEAEMAANDQGEAA